MPPSLIQRYAALEWGNLFLDCAPWLFPHGLCLGRLFISSSIIGDRVTLRQRWLDALFSWHQEPSFLKILSKEALKCSFCCTRQPSSSAGSSRGTPSLPLCWHF